MAKIANADSTGTGLKVAIHRELANYVFPKLKAVEHTGNVEGGGSTRIEHIEVNFIGTAPASGAMDRERD